MEERKYHKHDGVSGSHLITSAHKDASAQKAHDNEIKSFGKDTVKTVAPKTTKTNTSKVVPELARKIQEATKKMMHLRAEKAKGNTKVKPELKEVSQLVKTLRAQKKGG